MSSVMPVTSMADQNRLARSSSHVTVTNNSSDVKHTVIDRYLVGHDLVPGQTKPIEMLDEDIKYFQSRAEHNHPISIAEAPGRSPEQLSDEQRAAAELAARQQGRQGQQGQGRSR